MTMQTQENFDLVESLRRCSDKISHAKRSYIFPCIPLSDDSEVESREILHSVQQAALKIAMPGTVDDCSDISSKNLADLIHYIADMLEE